MTFFLNKTVEMNSLIATADDKSADQISNVALNVRTSLADLLLFTQEGFLDRQEGVQKALTMFGYHPTHGTVVGLNELMGYDVSGLTF